jgi:hypothetical protein
LISKTKNEKEKETLSQVGMFTGTQPQESGTDFSQIQIQSKNEL